MPMQLKVKDDASAMWTAVFRAIARCNTRCLQQAVAKPKTQEAMKLNFIDEIGLFERMRKIRPKRWQPISYVEVTAAGVDGLHALFCWWNKDVDTSTREIQRLLASISREMCCWRRKSPSCNGWWYKRKRVSTQIIGQSPGATKSQGVQKKTCELTLCIGQRYKRKRNLALINGQNLCATKSQGIWKTTFTGHIYTVITSWLWEQVRIKNKNKNAPQAAGWYGVVLL